MFLTTESSLVGRNYNGLEVIFATATFRSNKYSPDDQEWDTIIERALGRLRLNAENLGADGVIGVHHSIAVEGSPAVWSTVSVMGTAIKWIV